jgi:hypothetical protein
MLFALMTAELPMSPAFVAASVLTTVLLAVLAPMLGRLSSATSILAWQRAEALSLEGVRPQFYTDRRVSFQMVAGDRLPFYMDRVSWTMTKAEWFGSASP